MSAPLPPVPKVLRVDFQQTLASVNVRNRIFLQYTGTGPAVSDLNTLGATISSQWSSHMASAQNTELTLAAIEITDLTNISAAQTLVTSGVAGTGASSILANGAAAVIRFKIARRYRGGHPRFYLAGLMNTDLTNGSSFTGTFVGNLATAWSAFINGIIATPPAALGTLSHVNVSYFQGFTNKTFPSGRMHPVPTQRTVPLVDAVLAYSVNPIPGSQRRRNHQSP